MKTLIMRALLLGGISTANAQTDWEERDITISISCKEKVEAPEIITGMRNERGGGGAAAFKAGKKLKTEMKRYIFN